MLDVNRSILLIILLVVSVYFLTKFLYNNWSRITTYDDTPIQKAKRALWRSKLGTKEREDLELKLDSLVIKELNKATTLCMLYNAYEAGLTYTTFFGLLQKQRCVTQRICTAYTEKKGDILEDMQKAEKRRDTERHNHTKENPAPRLQKLDRRGQKDPGNVCNMAFLRKTSDSRATLH